MELTEIIKNIHRQWLVAKEQRRQRCEVGNLTEVAHKLAVCDMFKGSENLADITALFTTAQGLEFCLAANFPNLATFRLFKPYKPEQYGFYIDAGQITLRNPKTAVLIGRTFATIKCDTCESHEVVAMHGATAAVFADKWAVVHVQSGVGSSIVRRTTGNAIIL